MSRLDRAIVWSECLDCMIILFPAHLLLIPMGPVLERFCQVRDVRPSRAPDYMFRTHAGVFHIFIFILISEEISEGM